MAEHDDPNSTPTVVAHLIVRDVLPALSGVPPVLWTVKGLRAPVSFGRSFHS